MSNDKVEKKVVRCEQRQFGDSEGRSIVMLTDIETGETKFLGEWAFVAKMIDSAGGLHEKPDVREFPIDVPGEGKSIERILETFALFDTAREAYLKKLNAGLSKLSIVGKG